MIKVINIITDTVDKLFLDYNYGKSETKIVMPYCRISVEKFLFNKINDTIIRIYECKFRE